MGIIRLLLALSVVAAHCGVIWRFNLVGGKMAVESFYIISGFYMSLILNEKYIGANSSYKLFLSNRFLRLYPIYWGVLITTVLACVVIAMSTHGASLSRLEGYTLVKSNIVSFAFLALTNIAIFGQDLVMFLGITPENGQLFFTSNFRDAAPQLHTFLFIPQAWTLALELIFYMIAPFIMRRGYKVVLPLIIGSLLLRFYIYDFMGLQNDPWTHRFFPTELVFFLLGYVSYRINLRIKSINISKYIHLSILLYVVVFSLVYRYLPAVEVPYLPFSLREILYFSSITAFIPFLFNYLKTNKWDNLIGELSYPVYISHILVLTICSALPFLLLKTPWAMTLLTIVLSILLNKFIATPLEQYRQSRVKK